MIHVPNIPMVPGFWVENWIRGTGEPDRWTASKKYISGVVVHEVEFSNASFYSTHKGAMEFDANVQVDRPRGYTLIADCDRPLPTRWYPMHACMRRYAMYPSDRPDLRPEAERAARGAYSVAKWRRGRRSYGPCNLPLPDLTSSQMGNEAYKVSTWLGNIRSMLTLGGVGTVEDSEDGLQFHLNGWNPWGRHPDGSSPPPRDAPGGSGIFFYTGWEQSPDFPAYAWLVACCNHERWWHAYERGTGRPINVYDYPDPGPMYQVGTYDPNNGWLPEFRGVAQNPDPLPLPYDASHSIRGFRHLVACSEMIDSPAVKRMLRSIAAQFRLQYSDRGPGHQASGYDPPCLRSWLHWAQANPHEGHLGQDTGRMMGWPAFVIAQSVKLGYVENKPWAQMFCDLANTATMPNGIISRCHESNPASVWYDPLYDTAHSFEVPIYWHGAVGCSRQDNTGLFDPIRFAEVLYDEAPLYPYYSGHGPPQYAYVANRDGIALDTVTSGKNAGMPNSGDSTHALAGCALAASIQPSNRAFWISQAANITSFSNFKESAGIVAQQQL